MNLSENAVSADTISFLLTDAFYTVDDSGQVGSQPKIHLCGRTERGERIHRVVTDYFPYFLVSHDEFVRKRDVIQTEMGSSSPDILDYEFDYTGIDPDSGEMVELVKLICETPYAVPRMRETFEQTWEADVLFTYRFLIDMGITDGVRVPSKETECSYEAVVPTPVGVEPRVCVYDIEVHTGGGGLPDYELPQQPITAITMFDSYTELYWTGVLEHTLWSDVDRRDVKQLYENADVDGEIHVYHDEQQLVYDAIEQICAWDSDVISGWNSSYFDTPYLLNRSLELRCGNASKLSPTGDVSEIESVPYDTDRNIKGRCNWDALYAYKKANIGEEKSYSLDAVANSVLGWGKDDVDDLDESWKRDPATFVKYNLKDVRATVGIIEEDDLLEMFLSLQSVTGTLLNDLTWSNKDMIDLAFLRRAQEHDSEA